MSNKPAKKTTAEVSVPSTDALKEELKYFDLVHKKKVKQSDVKKLLSADGFKDFLFVSDLRVCGTKQVVQEFLKSKDLNFDSCDVLDANSDAKLLECHSNDGKLTRLDLLMKYASPMSLYLMRKSIKRQEPKSKEFKTLSFHQKEAEKKGAFLYMQKNFSVSEKTDKHGQKHKVVSGVKYISKESNMEGKFDYRDVYVFSVDSEDIFKKFVRECLDMTEHQAKEAWESTESVRERAGEAKTKVKKESTKKTKSDVKEKEVSEPKKSQAQAQSHVQTKSESKKSQSKSETKKSQAQTQSKKKSKKDDSDEEDNDDVEAEDAEESEDESEEDADEEESEEESEDESEEDADEEESEDEDSDDE